MCDQSVAESAYCNTAQYRLCAVLLCVIEVSVALKFRKTHCIAKK